MTDQLALNDIKHGLSSSDFKVRKKYVMLLSRIDKPEVINLLTPLLNDDIQEIREQSKKIIDYLNEKYGSYEELIATEEKIKIKKEIEKSFFDPSKLIQLILTDDIKVKISSIMSFYGVKDEQVLKVLIKFIQLEENPQVLATYIKAIGSIGGSNELNLIKKYLKHSDSRVKSNTIEALEELGAYEEVIEVILPLIKSHDERLKITAEQYINRIDFEVLLSVFKEMINSNKPEIIDYVLEITLRYPFDETMDFYDEIFHFLNKEQKKLLISSIKNIDKDIANDFIGKHNFIDEKIIQNYKPIISTKPLLNVQSELNYTDDFYSDGLKFIESKNYDKAILEFDKSLKINPRHFESWVAKGEALLKLENYTGANYCFDRAISINSENPNVYQLKGKTLQFLFLDVEADVCFKKAQTIQVDKINNISSTTQKYIDFSQKVIDETKNFANLVTSKDKINDLLQKAKKPINESIDKISNKVNKILPIDNSKENNIILKSSNLNVCLKCKTEFNKNECSCPNCGYTIVPNFNNNFSDIIISFKEILKNKFIKIFLIVMIIFPLSYDIFIYFYKKPNTSKNQNKSTFNAPNYQFNQNNITMKKRKKITYYCNRCGRKEEHWAGSFPTGRCNISGAPPHDWNYMGEREVDSLF